MIRGFAEHKIRPWNLLSQLYKTVICLKNRNCAGLQKCYSPSLICTRVAGDKGDRILEVSNVERKTGDRYYNIGIRKERYTIV